MIRTCPTTPASSNAWNRPKENQRVSLELLWKNMCINSIRVWCTSTVGTMQLPRRTLFVLKICWRKRWKIKVKTFHPARNSSSVSTTVLPSQTSSLTAMKYSLTSFSVRSFNKTMLLPTKILWKPSAAYQKETSKTNIKNSWVLLAFNSKVLKTGNQTGRS